MMPIQRRKFSAGTRPPVMARIIAMTAMTTNRILMITSFFWSNYVFRADGGLGLERLTCSWQFPKSQFLRRVARAIRANREIKVEFPPGATRRDLDLARNPVQTTERCCVVWRPEAIV